ncbi:hypothetical protein FMN50_09715 [Rhodobacterales bacterium]|nr:hypothetical protein FMN50_09715 [Rhodobacterales bacterium]
MTKLALMLAVTVCASGSAFAGGIPQPGDFYLISRDRFGDFVGSHKLFVKYSDGLTKVAYCRRPYFVRTNSVAWTQIEVERGNVVQIEFNFGRGWRPICANPERQVTLTDIGVEESPADVLAQADTSSEEADSGRNRLSNIGPGFGGNDNGTYHAQ